MEFVKHLKDGKAIHHNSRIITYVDVQKRKPVSLLTNELESDPEEIIAIYRRRWEIELLFKQMKQNLSLKYFYGESANAIKIQIRVTLIANLLLMVMQKGLKRKWSFSELATNGQNNSDILRRFLQPVQQPRKRVGNHSFRGLRSTARTVSV